MTIDKWSLILLLALCAYGLRFTGLLIGDWLDERPKLKVILEDLPGCLVVALVAASLSQADPAAWIAAPAALAIAIWRANVVLVMIISTLIFALMKMWIG